MHYIFGDIHGCGIEFQHLIENVIEPLPNDKLICVGDLFDRGLHSHIVWEMIHKYNIAAVLGNHEHKYLRYFRTKDNGGQGWLPPHYVWAMENIVWTHRLCSIVQFREYLEGLPLILVNKEQRFMVAHAGVDIDNPLVAHESYNVFGGLRGKKEITWWDNYNKDYVVIYGHLSQKDHQPRIRYNSIGIDTATCHGGPLTAFCPETNGFYSYQSKVNWHSKFKEINKNEP